jgi:hypothetical protein
LRKNGRTASFRKRVHSKKLSVISVPRTPRAQLLPGRDLHAAARVEWKVVLNRCRALTLARL